MKTVFRTRLATAVILMLVFAAGGAVGGAIYSLMAPQPAAGAGGVRSGQRPSRTDGGRQRTRIVDRVGLTAEQKVKVDSIVEYYRANADQLWREWRSSFDAVSDSTRAEIRRVLTPDQQARYDSLRAERQRRQNERSGPREQWDGEWER